MPKPAPIPAARHAHDAEQLRAQLADFWGKPIRRLPRGMDLLQAMHITATGTDLTEAPKTLGLYLAMCNNFAHAYRTSEVWVAPDSMAAQLTQHPGVNHNSTLVGSLEDAAPARDGLAYFPTPIHLDDAHPIHGIAWHMEGTGNDLALAVETITTTGLIPTRLPPLLAESFHLPRTPYAPNGVTTLFEGILSGYSNPHLFGAPDKATALALVLAFWDLRRPTDAPDGPDEDTLTVPQHTSTGTKNTGRSRKNKRNNRAPRKRRIRIIREPANSPAPTGQDQPTADTSGHKWKDDTLRWKVPQKYQNRCPNPHQHRAIIEAGGECKPVLVPVKEHFNGPKGRDVDPRRTVRIAPDRP